MKFYSFIFFFLPSFVLAQEIQRDTIDFDGLSRDFIIHYPTYYDGSEPMPLVFNFHGFGSSATQQMFFGDFRSIAEREGFILVHPQGTDFFGLAHWNVGGFTIGSSIDDVGFTNAMIDHISSNFNIDAERIYATGMSNGGFMSFLLACQLGNRIAAIASVTGSMTPEITMECNPSHPTPIMQIHGTNDGVVPYDGADFSDPIDDVINYWVDFNNCNESPTINQIEDTNTNDGSTAEHFVYNNCDNNASFEHFKIENGTHTWPGTSIGGNIANQDINASEEIWTFFSRYTLSGEALSNIDEDLNIASANIYPNPSNGLFQVDSQSNQDYQIFSSLGNLLTAGTLYTGSQELDLLNLPPGTYIFKTNSNSQKLIVSK